MCGIVGLFLKNPELAPTLGDRLSAMLIEMINKSNARLLRLFGRPVAA